MAETTDRIQALLAEGVRQQQAENFDAAERSYRAILELDPTQPQALALLGMISGMFGNFQTAIDFFLNALERDPDNADLYHNLGETYRHLGDIAKAMPCFAKAIELRPELFMAYRSAADVALAAMDKAETSEHAAELKRLALQYLRALGKILHTNRDRQAEGVLREAVELAPFDPAILIAFANFLYDCGLLNESVDMYRRSIAADGQNLSAYIGLGTGLYALRRWDEAQEVFRAALSIDPNHKIARANLVTCDLMYQLYEDEPTSEEIYTRHRRWGDAITAELAPVAKAESKAFPNTPDPDRRLRVGFISGDFRDHPVGLFFQPLLENYDRNAIDIYCYTEQERQDHYTPTLQAIGGTWRVASVTASDAALRAQLRADAIDIAIDLAGQTAGTRLSALAVRATPVTATWLGYPATTGLPTIDWRITDAVADPAGYERYYSEKLMRLPDGFLCYQPRAETPPTVSPLPAMARGTVTFGSFNNLQKVAPATVRCWAAIFAALPTARLVLKAADPADPSVRLSFAETFSTLGIRADRVELRPQTGALAAHFSAYDEIDIGLDPLGYNGTTTTCEALWMGVPVITLIGNRHASRVGLDLLTRVGLSEFAAPDIDAYVARAVSLASDLTRLAGIRGELRERMRRSPLCDATRFTRQFEAGLREMWRAWCTQTA